MADTYTCAACGGMFNKGWSDDEARAEQEANGFDVFDCAVVCDDCYKQMVGDGMPIAPPEPTPDMIDGIILGVAELPDRDSPEDWPEAMLVTGNELGNVIERVLEDAAPAPRAELSAFQDDLAAILRAAGLSDAARPYSPHEVVHRDLLPHISALRAVSARYVLARDDAAGFHDRVWNAWREAKSQDAMLGNLSVHSLRKLCDVLFSALAPPAPAESDAPVAQWEPSPNMIAAATQLLAPADRHIDVRSLLIAAHRARPPETDGSL